MQDELFSVLPALTLHKASAVVCDEAGCAPAHPRRRSTEVLPLPLDDATRALASALNPRIRLGASTWSYPGWAGIVWDEGPYSEAVLAKNGLAAYAQHQLLRCVGIDRSFYRPLTEAQ